MKPGTGPQFESVAKELIAAVRANEPGCKLYVLHRAEAADTYVFLERYVDQAAIDAHRQTDHMKTIGKRMGEFMAARPTLMMLTEVE